MHELRFPGTEDFSRSKRAIARHQIACLIFLIPLGAIWFEGGWISSLLAQGSGLANAASSTTSAVVIPAKPSAAPWQSVSGVVLDENTDKPIGNALVRVSSPAIDMRSVRGRREGVYDTRTDAGGHFNVQVPPNEKLSFNVFVPGFEEAAGPWMRGNGTFHEVAFPSKQKAAYTIKLKPALYVAGLVVDESGRPVSDAHVEATMREERGYGYVAFDETDAKGRFAIFDFSPQPSDFSGGTNARGQLTFEHLAMLRSTIEDVYPLAETERANLRVTLHRGHEVKGRLTTATGQPVAETVVEGVPADGKAARKSCLTDFEGRFAIRGLPNGEVTLTAHSLTLKLKARTVVQMADADAEVNLRLEPVVYKNPPRAVSLFGMKLADVTSEVQAAYDLSAPRGVVILDPGANHLRLGIGGLSEGECFWIVGNRPVMTLRELVAELLRINAIDPPGEPNEGCRGSIRVVYEYPRGAGTNTQRLTLTDSDVEELRRLAASLALDGAGR